MAGYPSSFHFVVEWDGSRVSFSEVSGLSQEVSAADYRASSPAGRRVPGLHKEGTVTLKRGVAAGRDPLVEWLSSGVDGHRADRRDLALTVVDEHRNPVARWRMHAAFPVKLEGPALKATGNEIAIESLEIAHEGLSLE